MLAESSSGGWHGKGWEPTTDRALGWKSSADGAQQPTSWTSWETATAVNCTAGAVDASHTISLHAKLHKAHGPFECIERQPGAGAGDASLAEHRLAEGCGRWPLHLGGFAEICPGGEGNGCRGRRGRTRAASGGLVAGRLLKHVPFCTRSKCMQTCTVFHFNLPSPSNWWWKNRAASRYRSSSTPLG